MKKFLIAVCCVVVLLMAISKLGHLQSARLTDGAAKQLASLPVSDASLAPVSVSSSSSVEPPAAIVNWRSSESIDDMRGVKTRSASTDGLQPLDFRFPYSGGSVPQLTVRRTGKRLDIILSVSKGQFLCMVDGCSISVKFDDHGVKSFRGVEASDGSTNVIFLEPETAFLQQLQRSSHVIIEAEFYREGRRQMDFATSGLSFK